MHREAGAPHGGGDDPMGRAMESCQKKTTAGECHVVRCGRQSCLEIHTVKSCTPQNSHCAGRLAISLLALCLVSQAMPVFARDTRLVLPIYPVMQQPATRDAIGNDVQLRFATAPQPKAPQAQMLVAQSYARPYSSTAQRYLTGGR